MQNPVAIEFRHLHIADDHVRALELGALHTLSAVFGLDHLIARQLEDVSSRGPEELVVLDEENLLQGWRTWVGREPLPFPPKLRRSDGTANPLFMAVPKRG